VAQQNGLLVDEQCRTSADGIYAAGDVANHLHPVLGRVRVEHYNSAGHHGAAAARSMLGSAAPFDYIHNFWSDQYEHTLQYVGHATRWDDFAVRGSLHDGKFVGFYLDAGVVRAAIGFDRGGDPEYESDSEMAACAQLVARRAQPDRSLLTDEHMDLRSLAQRRAAAGAEASGHVLAGDNRAVAGLHSGSPTRWLDDPAVAGGGVLRG
jgi:3-phenylpropionate/trans-cinnamate dioxygenase ferredoxin reductase component